MHMASLGRRDGLISMGSEISPSRRNQRGPNDDVCIFSYEYLYDGAHGLKNGRRIACS